MDIIKIRQLQSESILGINAWEKQIKTKVILDLDIAINNSQAAFSDDIQDTIDYDKLASNLSNWIKKQNFNLLDTLAEKTSQYLLENYSIPWLKLSITKPGIVRNTQAITICIEREKKEA